MDYMLVDSCTFLGPVTAYDRLPDRPGVVATLDDIDGVFHIVDCRAARSIHLAIVAECRVWLGDARISGKRFFAYREVQDVESAILRASSIQDGVVEAIHHRAEFIATRDPNPESWQEIDREASNRSVGLEE